MAVRYQSLTLREAGGSNYLYVETVLYMVVKIPTFCFVCDVLH